MLRRPPVYTLESLAQFYISCEPSKPFLASQIFLYILAVIQAYAPGKDDLEQIDLVIEVIRRAGGDVLSDESNEAIRRRNSIIEKRRVARYEAERAQQQSGGNSSVVELC